MKIIILAAGVGSRLGKVHPKTLTPLIDGKSILDHQIDGLCHYVNMDDIYIIVGYKKKMIINSFPQLSYFYNENFKTTNTAKSLLIGLNALNEHNILWLNGDVVFDHRIIKKIIEYPGACMAVNKSRVGEEEVKYRTNNQGFVIEVSKEVDAPEGESVGIHKLSNREILMLREYLSDCNNYDYFEKGLELAIQNGLKVAAVDISNFMCMEIDFVEDLNIVNEYLDQYVNEIYCNKYTSKRVGLKKKS